MSTNNSTVGKIAGYLRNEIMHGNLKSGDHLKETRIAKLFNISRVPVREALRILHSEGYLEMIPNRGSFVKKITASYLYETSKLYVLIAPELLRNCIPKYKKSTLERAGRVIAKLEKCTDHAKVGYLMWDFAKIIYGPTEYRLMYSLMDEMYKHNIRILNELFELRFSDHYDVTPHKRFIELCGKNKVEEAVSVWCDYIKKLTADFFKSKMPKK